VSRGAFEVYVYANDHNPPHCHLFWDGGDSEAIIDLRTLGVIRGDVPGARGLRVVTDNRDSIVRWWNRLNPDKMV
jgi:hypothetical protein